MRSADASFHADPSYISTVLADPCRNWSHWIPNGRIEFNMDSWYRSPIAFHRWHELACSNARRRNIRVLDLGRKGEGDTEHPFQRLASTSSSIIETASIP